MYGLPLLGNSAIVSPMASDAQGRLAPPSTSGLTSAAGQAVSFTARVTPTSGAGLPEGAVQFSIDGSALGAPVPLINGSATLPPVTSLAAGNHSITASYLDTPDFAASTSGTFTHTVESGQTSLATSTTVSSSLNPSTAGAAVQFRATVTASSGTPTGTVQFLVDGSDFGSPVTLVNGVANSAVTTSLAQGAHTITAVYSGDPGFNASTSQALTQNVRPTNDAFSNRITLSGNSATATGGTVGATKESGEPNHAGNTGGKSVWYTWTAPSAGTVTLDTLGSSFNTLLATYTGSSVSALSAVSGGSNNDSPAGGTTTSKVTFNVTAGTAYRIAIDGFNGGSGNYALHLNFAPAIPTVPTNVSATDGTYTDRVRITWAASNGATSYEVWRATKNSSSSAVKISTSTLTGTTFDDFTASKGKVYYYFVKAKNASGTSGFSASNSGYRR
jgi:hypothetical protein